jgi:methylsterol monooxygenase
MPEVEETVFASTDDEADQNEDEAPIEIGRKRYRFLDSVRTAIVVIGAAAIVFIAFRNTVTWQPQRFWGASGDFWQSQWEKIYDWFEGDSYKMGVYGTMWVSSVAFWLFNAFFILLDLFEWPEFLLRYKIQPTEKVTRRQMLKAAARANFNNLVVGYFLCLSLYCMMEWRNCDFGRTLPTFPWVVWELFVFIWVEEFGFYYGHRLAHHPKLYKHVHKIHHEFTAPISTASIYAHPLEHALVNTLPMFLGPLICGSHVSTLWLWAAIGIFSTTISHSGYHLPFLPSPEAHDFHHLKFNTNYGMLGVLDRLHGTDALFRKSKAYERHSVLLSLVPARELIPDDNKTKSQ